MNYTVYVLKSEKFNHYYVGQTNDLINRIDLHNSGKVISTRRYKPWIIIYTEKFDNRMSAVKREKYFKSHAGRKWLKNKFMGQ